MGALVYGAVMAAALMVVAGAYLTGGTPFPAAAALYCFGAGLILVRPFLGLYLIVFFTLLADKASAPWYPFIKNGSSPESVLYVSDAIIVNPLEGYLLLTLMMLFVHLALGRVTLDRSTLPPALALFLGFITFGLVWGLVRGGDPNVALWEVRPFVVLGLTVVFASALAKTSRALHALVWVALAAIVVESFYTLGWYLVTRPTVDSLIEHQGALHINLAFTLIVAAIALGNPNPLTRVVLPLAAVPMLFVYLLSERRAAIGALVIGIGVVLAVLAGRDRARFWSIAPVLGIVFATYLGIFWTASGPAAFPAAAIRSQIAGGTATASDASSDAYRELENINIVHTIKAAPLTGIGFGQKFHRPVALPDISGFFIWWEYMTHNAILWIWLKAGVGGFLMMFYWFTRLIQTGVRSAIDALDPDDATVLAAAAAYVPMFMVYTYLDLSWDPQTLVLLGIVSAVITGLPRARRTEATAARPVSGVGGTP